MNTVAQIATLVSVVAYLGAAPLEMFLIDKPFARRFLHVEADNISDIRMWGFVVGFRNALAGIGGLTGLIMVWNGHATAGRAVVLTVLSYMVLASLAMGVADLLGYWKPRGGSVIGTIGSSVPPLIAIVAMLGWD
ncbi:DUF1304 family protein [Longispora albida]|uniref:DUF1304 family protein n=1 Tax=Longispora albida TaxID=203523 RepID=UPI0003617FCA|nr:DUF1304 family protein [Longispora albida]